ncbi:uncharacterized protein METZ01_LOCUS329303, partial [marine metagenome]
VIQILYQIDQYGEVSMEPPLPVYMES